MSNRRRPAVGNTYRGSYLHSRAWFARRRAWFQEESTRTNGIIRCAVCRGRGTPTTLELHHLDYHGVRQVDGVWHALEAHEDLIAVHPDHHRLIHDLIDRDPILRSRRSRADATREAVRKLRTHLAQMITAGLVPA